MKAMYALALGAAVVLALPGCKPSCVKKHEEVEHVMPEHHEAAMPAEHEAMPAEHEAAPAVHHEATK